MATQFDASVTKDPRATLLDAARAQRVAAAHVASVRQELIAARSEAAVDPLAEALRVTEWRARTIAATETYAAANEELLSAAETVATNAGIVLLKEWNAEADACPVCAEYDGETVPIGADFSSGYSPGNVHPNCRCWTEIIQDSAAAAA